MGLEGGWGLGRGLAVSEGDQGSQSGVRVSWKGGLVKILQHCCGNSFSFLKWFGRGSGGPGEHLIMVYEYVYECGFEKRKDQRTESQTEGKIQYFTLATLFNGCNTSCVL